MTTIPPPLPLPAAGDYLAVTLGGEEYAIDIRPVREIRDCEGITDQPGAAGHVLGTVTLRGSAVPVLDLRQRLRPDHLNAGSPPVMIVLDTPVATVGLVADAVSDIITLGSRQILPVPDMAAIVDARYLAALAVLGERMLVLLDVDQLLADIALETAPTRTAHPQG